jgi:hypothetical protein
MNINGITLIPVFEKKIDGIMLIPFFQKINGRILIFSKKQSGQDGRRQGASVQLR